jgi:uncharacterized membrane protein
MPFRLNSSPGALERAISALCYLTGGIAGIIYIIISRASYQSDFFRFHFLQSIVLAILSLLLNWAFSALGMMLGPLMPTLVETLSHMFSGATAAGIGEGLMLLVNSLITAWSLLAVYGLVCAALGKFAEIPFISNVVRQQMR